MILSYRCVGYLIALVWIYAGVLSHAGDFFDFTMFLDLRNYMFNC